MAGHPSLYCKCLLVFPFSFIYFLLFSHLQQMKADTEENGNDDESTDNGELKKRPWPQRVKEGVKKLPKDVLKRRRNFRLKNHMDKHRVQVRRDP